MVANGFSRRSSSAHIDEQKSYDAYQPVKKIKKKIVIIITKKSNEKRRLRKKALTQVQMDKENKLERRSEWEPEISCILDKIIRFPKPNLTPVARHTYTVENERVNIFSKPFLFFFSWPYVGVICTTTTKKNDKKWMKGGENALKSVFFSLFIFSLTHTNVSWLFYLTQWDAGCKRRRIISTLVKGP